MAAEPNRAKEVIEGAIQDYMVEQDYVKLRCDEPAEVSVDALSSAGLAVVAPDPAVEREVPGVTITDWAAFAEWCERQRSHGRRLSGAGEVPKDGELPK